MASTSWFSAGRRARYQLRSCLLTAALFVSGLPALGTAQEAESGPWRLEVDGGGGVLISGHDHSVDRQLSPVARVVVGRMLGEHLAGAVEWVAAWPSSRITGGTEKRHHLGLGLSYRPSGPGPVLSVTAGPGLATVIRQDGPPEPPGMGDVDIGVGDMSGLGLVAGAGWAADAGGLTLTPRAGVLLQRVDGFTLSHVLLTMGVGFGG